MNAYDTPDNQLLITWFLLILLTEIWNQRIFFWTLRYICCFDAISTFLVTAAASAVIVLFHSVLICVWCDQGHVVLTDFGLCKEGVEPEGTTSTFCGTPEVRDCTSVQKKWSFALPFYSLCDSFTFLSSTCSIWPRRFFVRSHMTGRWTGGVWELYSMRWSTASYVCSLLHHLAVNYNLPHIMQSTTRRNQHCSDHMLSSYSYLFNEQVCEYKKLDKSCPW